MHIFSGRQRHWSLADATRRMGGAAIEKDKSIGDDLLDDAVYAQLYSALARGEVEWLWLGIVCNTFTAMWAWCRQHPFRSRRQPDGIEPMPAEYATLVATANELVRRGVELALCQWRAGGNFVIENPADQGNWSSPYYREEARHSVPLWLTTPMRKLAQLTRPYWVTTDLCAWFVPYKKPTTLCIGGPAAAAFAPFNRARCTHPKHAMRVTDVDGDGRTVSRKTGEYPPAFSAAAAFIIIHGYPPSMRDILSSPSAAAAFMRRYASQAANDRHAETLEEMTGGDRSARSAPESPPPQWLPSWRAAPELIPSGWCEAEDVQGPAYDAARAEPLKHISRRRAVSEPEDTLAARPMPTPSACPDEPARQSYTRSLWPQASPQRPIHISQLWQSGVYREQELKIAEVMASCTLGQQGKPMPKVESATWGLDRMSSFAAQLVRSGGAWDTRNHEDCVPLQPYDAAEPVPPAVNVEFFSYWCDKLKCGDRDMVEQVTVTGVEGRSKCSQATIIMGHHGGLRSNFQHAEKAIKADVGMGFVLPGKQHPRTVPAIMVARNCVPRTVYKSVDDVLQRVIKWRVTTDDTVSVDGEVSRNQGEDPDDWARAGLPGPRTLGEAVAIAKAIAAAMGIRLSGRALELVALWALDLSHAYRMLAVQRREWGQQQYIWYDGVRLDLRCLFGSAHMVEFFERVTVFVLKVAQHRIHEYDASHPYSPGRQAWSAWREKHVGSGEGEPTRSFIYLDDAHGFSLLDGGEALRGGNSEVPVRVGLFIGKGGSVRLAVFASASRPQVHLAIMRQTFKEAGWDIAIDKVQLGWSIDSLGFTVSAHGDGAMYVPEAKRRGMLEDMCAQQPRKPGEVVRASMADIDTLTGRCLHIGMVAPECMPYMAPMYRIKKATMIRSIGMRRVRVRMQRVTVAAGSPAAQQYQDAIQWWRHALEAGVSAPLAPRLVFPELGSTGVGFQFTDAAREARTGAGGFTVVIEGGGMVVPAAQFLFIDEPWHPSVLQQLRDNVLSMPAGEGIGVVMLADALASRLYKLQWLVIFTDSDPVAKAINSNNSASPQLNCIVNWLFARHTGIQFLAIHQPGKRNDASDRLSRDQRASVLSEAAAGGLNIEQLSPCPSVHTLIAQAASMPQTNTTRPRMSQAA